MASLRRYGQRNFTLFDHLPNSVQILELRDCKRSVKKDIIEECRVGWQEPEASDDEATYALVTSGIDIRLIPAGGDKFTMFSECPVAGIWPEWKERRDKERKDRFTALKARKDAALLRLKERDNQAEKERRAESLAASQMAREAAKRLANERAAAANAAKTKSGSSADRDKGKSRAPISVSESAQTELMRRESTDMSLSEIRARDKAANKFLGAINRSGNSQHDHVVDAAAAFASVTKHASSNSSQPGSALPSFPFREPNAVASAGVTNTAAPAESGGFPLSAACDSVCVGRTGGRQT